MTPKLAICLVGDVPDKGNRRGKGELGRVECKHQPMPARFKTCPGRQLYQPLPLTGSGLARQYGNGPEGLPPRSRLIREPEVGKSDSAAPLLAMGSGSKGLGAAGRKQNHSRDTMLPHNAGMEPASGITCNRLRRQGRFQNARKGQIEVHLYYISFKRKPATLEPNTSLRQRENPSRLFREASAIGIPPRTNGCQAFLFKATHFVAAAFDRTADAPRRDLGRHGSATTLSTLQISVLQIYNPKIDSLTE